MHVVVEFHLIERMLTSPPSTRVRWIVVRATSLARTQDDGWNSVASIDASLAQLADLEKFILETTYQAGKHIQNHFVQVRNKIHVWSRRDARRYAEQVANETLQEHQLPVSPLLHLCDIEVEVSRTHRLLTYTDNSLHSVTARTLR